MSTVHNDLSIYQSAALTAPTGEGEHAEEQGSLQGCLAALYCWHLGRTADLIAPAGEGEPAQEQGSLQGCLAALYGWHLGRAADRQLSLSPTATVGRISYTFPTDFLHFFLYSFLFIFFIFILIFYTHFLYEIQHMLYSFSKKFSKFNDCTLMANTRGGFTRQ